MSEREEQTVEGIINRVLLENQASPLKFIAVAFIKSDDNYHFEAVARPGESVTTKSEAMNVVIDLLNKMEENNE